ncbi:succinylglutamate desuccinylase/aspartoacylase family protein [Xenophilus arseniciresistens]|uniref:Succinylglutamate desuccinylase/aspartoacylase family protein n=1 Tax=Xenophilus arseniciresistens TaxID=1283306 RepID=A0AAE3NB70_9BURK|nr:succinylglutamate desuccinylase/aspartoacylase family protein [Xenophilus arseniciresistens]MDA7417102.1 succinylglutamate desuccinylase/aspartoacylase family protein [Xenophilus arseniciresistens]
MSNSRVKIDIPLDVDGKHVGYARLPHSVHRSAYGWLPIPIVSIRNGMGRTVLVMAGTHGDEYEGRIAASRLIQSIDPTSVQGQIIILPMANFPAAKEGLRVSPLDGGNLNRTFPGDAQGSITSVIAHFITTELVARADVVLDLHSGGTSLNYLPSTVSLAGDAPELLEKSKDLMQVFGAPYGILHEGRGGTGSSHDAAVQAGAIRIGTEFGGKGYADPGLRQLCEEGVRRTLSYLGVLRGECFAPAGPVQFVRVPPSAYVYADATGLFESQVALGTKVKAGDLAGWTYFPEEPLRPPQAARFQIDGIVICERSMAPCEIGDCLFHLGVPV